MKLCGYYIMQTGNPFSPSFDAMVSLRSVINYVGFGLIVKIHKIPQLVTCTSLQ